MEDLNACHVTGTDKCCASCEVESMNGRMVYDLPETSENGDMALKSFRPHGTLARTLYNKYLADDRLQRYDKRKWYQCDTTEMDERIQSRFLELNIDSETELFLDQSMEKSDWIFTQVWHSVVKSVLSWFLTQTSINGLLGRGSMFVFSRQQFQQMLSLDPDWKGDSLLDLGAGDGRTTEILAPLFQDVFVTEISGPMRNILAKRGFRILEIDKWADGSNQFDVITCLNLLDRCDQPLSLLQELKLALKPGGTILVALVLPYNPYVEIGRLDHKPTEWLSIHGSTFEDQVSSTIKNVLEPAGFSVIRWSRVPYLCEGDLHQSFYWLDDAIFVLKVSES